MKAAWMVTIGAGCTTAATDLSPRLQAFVGPDNLYSQTFLVDRFYDSASATSSPESVSGTATVSVAATTVAESQRDDVEMFPDLPLMVGPAYVAVVDPVAVGSVITFDVDATHSSATVPDDFTVAAVPNGTPRTEPLVITWAPASADLVTVVLSGQCLVHSGDPNNPGEAVPDTGSWTFPISAMDQIPDCTLARSLSVTVMRRRVGELDSAFRAGGLVEAIQSHQVGFEPLSQLRDRPAH